MQVVALWLESGWLASEQAGARKVLKIEDAACVKKPHKVNNNHYWNSGNCVKIPLMPRETG